MLSCGTTLNLPAQSRDLSLTQENRHAQREYDRTESTSVLFEGSVAAMLT